MFGEVFTYEANELNFVVGAQSHRPLLVEEELSLIIGAIYSHLSQFLKYGFSPWCCVDSICQRLDMYL